MKKLNLNETWRLCLSMWRWIAKEKRAGNTTPIESLKKEWSKAHGFDPSSDIYLNCFFCEYSVEHSPAGCCSCPGCKVDQKFDCINKAYNFEDKPIAFYNKIVSLNRKRLKK